MKNGSGRKRLHGEGTRPRLRPDGRWASHVTVSGKRRSVYGKTSSECSDRARDLLAEVRDGIVTDRSLTMAQLCAQWLAYKKNSERRPSSGTLVTYEWAVNRITEALGHIAVAALTADDVEQRFLWPLRDTMASSSRAKLVGRLRDILRWAQSRGKVSRNVAQLVDTPSVTYRRGRTLKPEQAAALIATARTNRAFALVLASLTLGLRPGEARALRWESVNFEAGTMTVAIQMDVNNEPTEVKTERSLRTIKMPAVLVEALKERRRTQIEERLKAGPAWVERGYVFTTRTGTAFDRRNYARTFARLTKKAGLGDDWRRPYELRHSCASLLLAAGVPREQVADLLGHQGTRMIDTVYGHRVDEVVEVRTEAAFG